MAEGRDWTRSQFEPCPDCGTDAASVADGDLGREVMRAVAAWGRSMAAADPVAVRQRPADGVWSALEYACHVRDVLPVMAGRIDRMLVDDAADLGWWDHEAAAIEEDYNAQVPVLVIEQMTANGRAFAAVLDRVGDDEWDREATRRAGETFTIRGIGRFVLHEVVHHRVDAERSRPDGG